jgi:hypothetical protein
MSMTDVRAALDPDWAYLVVGLGEEVQIRAWLVRNGESEEIPLG